MSTGESVKSDDNAFLTFLTALILGLIVFVFVTGGMIIFPTNTEWLLRSGGDTFAVQLTFMFSREAPLFQWPLLANFNYGMEISQTDVAFPLLILLDKLFRVFLPDTIQYVGVFTAFCFVMQAYFAMKLLSLFTQKRILVFLGSIFFVISPAMLLRMPGHVPLYGHYVIVAGLYFYLRRKFSTFSWTALLAITILLHGNYFPAMLFPILIADLIKRHWIREHTVTAGLVALFVPLMVFLALAYAIGYFSMSFSDYRLGGFGFYRMNLLSPINPGFPSFFLNAFSFSDSEYEGFNFLGLGMLFLMLISLGIYFGSSATGNALHRPSRFVSQQWIPYIFPLVFLFVLFTCYALSNNVYFGTYQVFTLPEELFTPLRFVLRASGRFFWPVLYGIYAAVFFVLFRKCRFFVTVLLCTASLTIQVFDYLPGYQYNHELYSQLGKNRLSVFQSDVWSVLSNRYDAIRFVPPAWGPGFLDQNSSLVLFAAKHKMKVNSAYYSRNQGQLLAKASDEITQKILNDDYESDSLYVFSPDSALSWLLWNSLIDLKSSDDIVGIVDGYHVLAPGLRTHLKATDKEKLLDDFQQPLLNSFFVPIDEWLVCSNGGNGTRYMGNWHAHEPEGTWSAEESFFYFSFDDSLRDNDIRVTLQCYALVSEKHRQQEFMVFANGNLIQQFESNLGTGVIDHDILIPHDLLDKNGSVILSIRALNHASPQDILNSPDLRQLGLRLHQFKVNSAEKLEE